MYLKNFDQAQYYLLNKKGSQNFPGEFGLKRAKKFITSFCKIKKEKLIHVAGTSGKGSVSYLISTLLKSQNFKVGLHLSPHIVNIRERIQINNEYISEDKLVKYLNEIFPFINEMEKLEYGSPSYFEILVGLSIYSFIQEKVDYIILETGLGGLYDGTNIFEDKISVLTKIGLDHTDILGKTLKDIAFQKSAIIKNKNIVLSTIQKPEVTKVINDKIKIENAHINFVKTSNHRCDENGTYFDFSFCNYKINKIKLGMHGLHQAKNCSLALATIVKISERDKFDINEQKLKNSLLHTSLIGRMEILKSGDKTVIIDGAHNPSKMKCLINSIKEIFPNTKFDFLIGFSEKKDHKKMLEYIKEISNKIYTTSFYSSSQDQVRNSINPEIIKEGITISDCHLALKEAMNSKNLVITGSFYLLGEIYNNIYQLLNLKINNKNYINIPYEYKDVNSCLVI